MTEPDPIVTLFATCAPTVGARAEDIEPEVVESDGDDEDYAVAV